MSETHESLLKVVRHCQESLDKYTENRNDGKLLHYLQKLYKLPIKVVHLEETGVGRTVNGLRKLGGDVGDSAKSLVAKWKEMVVGEQEEEDDDDEDDEDDDEEDGYQTGEEQSDSDDGHEVKHSSSHKKSDNRDDRSKKQSSSKSERHSSDSRKKEKERERHNGHSKHKSHKRKVESEESEDESSKKRRRNDDEHRHRMKKRDSDGEEVRSKEKKHKERRRDSDEEEDRRKEKKHKSSKKGDSDDEDVRKKERKHKYDRSDSEEEVKAKEKKHKSDKNKVKKSDSDNSKSSKKEKPSDNSSKEKDKQKSPRKEDSKKHDSSKTKESNKKSREKDKVKSEEKKKKTLNGTVLQTGIDSGSGASFAEALGMCEPSSSSKSVAKKKTTEKKEKYKPEDVVPKLLKEPTIEPVDINLSSLLPPITPNYRPLGNLISADSQPKKVLSESETLSNIISSKNQRTKVYSGNKMALGKVPSLFEICTRILQDNIDALEYTGGVPYSILKPILEKATPNQLYTMEHHNPYLIEETDELWQLHCQKEFRNKRREEMETWREMYLRCLDERDAKLKALTANIKQSQDKSLPVRMTKLAYVDAVAKPPRNIARKQAKNGTAFDVRKPAMTPTARLNSLATSGDAGKIAVPNPGSRAVDRASGHAKPKKAPLMLKSITSFKNRFKR